MNMKKILIAMLVVLCMIFGLVACGGGTSDPVQPDEVIVDTSDDTTTAEPETPAVEDPTVDQVLFNQDGITIVCKGFVPGSDDGWDDPALKFLITNDTDKNIIVQVRDVSVNGFMIDPFCSEDVAAGKKMNGDMSWLQMYFDENGITSVENIEFYFHIYEDDIESDWSIDSDIVSLNFN